MNTLEKVQAIITQQLKVPAEKITEDARLVEDLGADSANVMVLIMDLEDAFNMTVDDAAITTLRTVGDVAKYIEEHQ